MDEVTLALVRATQGILGETYGTLKKAVENPQDEIDRHVLALWTEIQTMLGGRLGRLRDEGALTLEQYDFGMDWLVYWVENGPEESEELLNAWLDLCGEGQGHEPGADGGGMQRAP